MVKLAHLHGYIQERTQQAAFAIADNALYHNASFLQRCDLLSVALNRLVLDFEHRQRPLTDRVIQHHDAPFSPEAGSIHDEVNRRLWQRAFSLCSSFGKVRADDFEAASVLPSRLCGALLAFAVALPKGVGIETLAPYELALKESQWYCCFPLLRCPFFLTCLEPQKSIFCVQRF